MLLEFCINLIEVKLFHVGFPILFAMLWAFRLGFSITSDVENFHRPFGLSCNPYSKQLY